MFIALAVLLVGGAALTFAPLWAPLVLAAWVAVLARPLLVRVSAALGGRGRAAGSLVVSLVVVILLPLALATISLVRGATDLARSVMHSSGAKSALVAIASDGASPDGAVTLRSIASPQKIMALVQEHGAAAMQVIGDIAGMASEALLGLFVFIYAVYVFLVDGPAQYAWLERHAPLDVAHTRRFTKTFHETGRGLIVGIGLTGLAQGLVATVTYIVLGVPRALVLGLLTCVASLLPSVGTALVWVPVAIGLALAGKTGAAIALAVVGIVVIGTVDNLLRPVFARFGELDLSTFVLLTSIFGGLATFGAWGLLLGPLFARMTKEALLIIREDKAGSR